MRVVLIMTMTADGFISRDAGDAAGWVEEYDKLFFDKTTRSIGTVIIGANSFSQLPEPFEGRRTIVMTSNPNTEKAIPNVLEFSNLEPQELLNSLEDEGVTEVAIIGGSQVNSSFLQERLIDELYLTVAPLLFGKGLSLAPEYDLDQKLQLIDEEKLSENVVLLHYEVLK